MGVLVYDPVIEDKDSFPEGRLDLDFLARESAQVLRGAAGDVLAELLTLNGSSGGARPKALVQIDAEGRNIIAADKSEPGYAPWLVKFSGHGDSFDTGAIEYVYGLMAKAAGLNMPELRLLPAPAGAGFFAVRRFDRAGDARLHMHYAAGLLHSDFRAPSLDYKDLMALTQFLTKDARETEKIFRLAAFNALAHNRDDHGKNFSFLMERNGAWRLSPAYDLTFSHGPGGEQSTMILGEGKNPGQKDLVKLAAHFKLNRKKAADIIDRVRAALNEWPQLAANYGVSRDNIAAIGRIIAPAAG